MTHSTSIRLGLAVAAATVIALPLPASALTPTSSKLSASVTDATPAAGQRTYISGVIAPKGMRSLQVQRLQGSTWVPTTSGKSASTGRYKVALPTTVYIGRASYRVLVTRTNTATEVASRTFAVDIDGKGSPTWNSVSVAGTDYGTDYGIVHWDPCTVIGYRINRANAPAAGVSEVQSAMRRVSAQTGLQFKYLGTTTVQTTDPGAEFPADTSYLVSWPTKGFPKGVAGLGGWQAQIAIDVKGKAVAQIAQGIVALNPAYYKKFATGYGSGPRRGWQGTRQQLLMHEIAHSVGLLHNNHISQTMYPAMHRSPAVWGDGDAAGLVRVGVTRSACIDHSSDTAARRGHRTTTHVMS